MINRRKFFGALFALTIGVGLVSQAEASYLFDGTNDRLIRTASVPVTTYPHSVSGWVKVSALGVNDAFGCIGVEASADNHFRYSISSTDFFGFQAVVSGSAVATATAAITSTTTWYHYLAVATSATDRAVYFNGSNVGTSATSKDPAGVDSVRFGEFCDGSNDFAGRLAHWAVWDIALDATDAANLASGDNPLAVEAADLVSYWPMTSDAVDAVGDFDLTPQNQAAIDGDNPTVDAPPGGTIAPLAQQYYQQGQ